MNKSRSIRCLLVLSLLLVLGGCGQTGDLYFPEDKTETTSGSD